MFAAFTKEVTEVFESHASFLKSALKVVCGSFLLALASQVSIPLPLTTVTFSLQTLAIFLIGYVLGPRLGVYSVLLYLAEGALGAPVFTLGRAGLPFLLSPLGGYYAGFVLAAFVAGCLKKETKLLPLFFGFLFANLSIYVIALPILAMFIGIEASFYTGFVPFVVGDLLKIGIAISLIRSKQFFN